MLWAQSYISQERVDRFRYIHVAVCFKPSQSSTHIVSSAYISDTFEVALCWDHDPIFTLNRLYYESSYMRIRAYFLSVSMCVYGYVYVCVACMK